MREPTTYSETNWTREIERALGELTDVEVCMKYSIRRAAVRRRRIELGIVRPPAEQPRFSRRQDKALGTLPDTELALEWGVDVYWVRKRRIELQTPAYEMPPAVESHKYQAPHQWTRREEAMLGTQPDTIIAERLGIGASTVTRHRQALQIAPFRRGGEIEWTEGMLRLLGEISDCALAREYEISHHTVKLKRIREGIPPYGKDEMDPEPELPMDVVLQIGKVTDQQLHQMYGVQRRHIQIYRALHNIPKAENDSNTSSHAWTKKEEAILGTMSDRRAATEIDVTPMQAKYRRQQLGIPPEGKSASMRWTKQRIAQLGTQPDHALARSWGVTQRMVREKREELEIDNCDTSCVQLPEEARALLGQLSDNQIAQRYGCSSTFIRKARIAAGIPPLSSPAKYRWKKKELAKLGMVHDEELAVELGLSPQFVAAKRCELGIQAYRRVRKVDWNNRRIVSRLGKVSDAQLADELGVTPNAVANQRRKRNIPAWNDG